MKFSERVCELLSSVNPSLVMTVYFESQILKLFIGSFVGCSEVV